MNAQKDKDRKRLRRKLRIRKKVRGTAERPRLTIFRSVKHLRCQVIDDDTGRTLLSMDTLSPGYREACGSERVSGGNCVAAERLGTVMAQKAVAQGIKSVVFDRNAYRFHGRVKRLADALRKAGLQF
jgi:large subunit ribosomal protein L18